MNIFSYLYGAITLYRLPFQVVPVQSAFNIAVLQPHYCRNNNGLG
jgi:hypothetical protein